MDYLKQTNNFFFKIPWNLIREPPPVAPSAPDPSLIPCPNCGRRFNETAAERHIPKCADIKAKVY